MNSANSTNIALTLFSLVMLANIVALVRHWRMMRTMQVVLNELIESQAQFNEIMEYEQRKRL